MITDPHFTALGAAGDEFLNFQEVDPDERYSRKSKEDLIGRIGIEAICILLEIICGEGIRT